MKEGKVTEIETVAPAVDPAAVQDDRPGPPFAPRMVENAKRYREHVREKRDDTKRGHRPRHGQRPTRPPEDCRERGRRGQLRDRCERVDGREHWRGDESDPETDRYKD